MNQLIKTTAASALLLLAGQVQADVAITYSNPTGQGEDMVLVVSGNRAAMQIPAGQGQDGRIIFDRDSNKMFMVMDSEQSYMDMDAIRAWENYRRC